MRALATAALLFTVALPALAADSGARPDPALVQAVADSHRSAKFVARDAARHPVEELSFFGLRQDMAVLEVWPGGGYWTEILGPYLQNHGTLAAAIPVTGEESDADRITEAWRKKVIGDSDRFGSLRLIVLGKGHFTIAPDESLDLILTFRNLHNWVGGGYAEEMLKSFYHALKPGGILGIEDHRARTDRPQDPKAADGYIREDYTVELLKRAGFELVGSSPINANPRDTKDWPQGVWTLPPTYTLGDKDHDKYQAIGEADNFVLKFRKPKR